MLKKYSGVEIIYGILFFVVHIAIETISYMLLYLRFKTFVAVLIVLMYDFFAFVPQSLIGEWHNKHKKVDIGYLGTIFLIIAIVLIKTSNQLIYILVVLFLSFGNAILHECGAIAVASVSKKNIFPSALFVSGGTIGIIIGRHLANVSASVNYLFIPVAVIIIILALTDKTWCVENVKYIDMNIANAKCSKYVIFAVAFAIVMVRSYMGFVLPLTWKEKFFHFALLFISLGVGKAFGGYLCDMIGYRTVGFISTILCLPFIILGNKFMLLSLLGVMLFSMTMSVTYAMLLSIIKQNPGVAFGVTTIALFAGVVPMFFVNFSLLTNTIIIVILSIVCFKLINITITE